VRSVVYPFHGTYFSMEKEGICLKNRSFKDCELILDSSIDHLLRYLN
jgi:hypothetical protein